MIDHGIDPVLGMEVAMKTRILLLLMICFLFGLTACESVPTTSPVTTLTTSTTAFTDETDPVFAGETVHSFAAGYVLNLSAARLGITATDNVDGDLSAQIGFAGEIDFEEPGEYVMTYYVTDSSGNIATFDVTIVLIDDSPRYLVDNDSFGDYFTVWLDQVVGGNSTMVYTVHLALNPGYDIAETVLVRLNVDTILGYRELNSIYFRDFRHQEDVSIELVPGMTSATYQYTVRVNAVEVHARPYETEIVSASGKLKAD